MARQGTPYYIPKKSKLLALAEGAMKAYATTQGIGGDKSFNLAEKIALERAKAGFKEEAAQAERDFEKLYKDVGVTKTEAEIGKIEAEVEDIPKERELKIDLFGLKKDIGERAERERQIARKYTIKKMEQIDADIKSERDRIDIARDQQETNQQRADTYKEFSDASVGLQEDRFSFEKVSYFLDKATAFAELEYNAETAIHLAQFKAAIKPLYEGTSGLTRQQERFYLKHMDTMMVLLEDLKYIQDEGIKNDMAQHWLHGQKTVEAYAKKAGVEGYAAPKIVFERKDILGISTDWIPTDVGKTWRFTSQDPKVNKAAEAIMQTSFRPPFTNENKKDIKTKLKLNDDQVDELEAVMLEQLKQSTEPLGPPSPAAPIVLPTPGKSDALEEIKRLLKKAEQSVKTGGK